MTLLTARETAARLRVSTATVYALAPARALERPTTPANE